MYLLCKENPKFDDTLKMREAAKRLGIPVFDDEYFSIGHVSIKKDESYFVYGMRGCVLPRVNCPDNILNKTEYLYDFSYLMSIIPNELFNYDAVLLTASEISWKHHFKLGDVFVRPNSGDKQFNGQIFTQREIRSDFPSIAQVYPWELCVVASPKTPPDKEYRCFVNNESIIACQYLPSESLDVPVGVLGYAKGIVEVIREKDPNAHTFVLDIAELHDSLSVIELNSWNSSGIYCIGAESLLKEIMKLEDS